MKKIRITTKSGELVQEFENINETGRGFNILSSIGSTINYILWDDLTSLNLLFQIIEVEEKAPVYRWLWIFKDHSDESRFVCSKQYFTREEASKYFGALLVKAVGNSLQEFEE